MVGEPTLVTPVPADPSKVPRSCESWTSGWAPESGAAELLVVVPVELVVVVVVDVLLAVVEVVAELVLVVSEGVLPAVVGWATVAGCIKSCPTSPVIICARVAGPGPGGGAGAGARAEPGGTCAPACDPGAG